MTKITNKLLYNRIIDTDDVLIRSGSPKQITHEGYKILEKYKVPQFVEHIDLSLFDEFKNDEIKLFVKLLSFVKEDAQANLKVHEIYYNTSVPKSVCEELLALAIRDRILNLTQSLLSIPGS